MATPVATGMAMEEYRAIKRHYTTLVDTLGKTVDPARFASRLEEKSLIGNDIATAAALVGVQTGPQRIAPVLSAVLAQISLNAALFHTFMDILKEENSGLADTIWQTYNLSADSVGGQAMAPQQLVQSVQDSLATSDLQTMELTERNQRKMETKFFKLVSHISTTLSRRMSMKLDDQFDEETFQQFREYVAGVCHDGTIEDKTTVREIFRAIRIKKLWDFNGNPYHLLLRIIEGVEDVELMESVEKAHENYYTQYLVARKVVHHILEHKAVNPEDYSPNFTKLSIRLEGINVNQCSVAYLIELWEAVKRSIKLPDLFSVLAAIEDGSLVVTWMVPVYAIPALMRLPRSSPDLFKKFSILRMTINGVCFFKMTSAALSAAKSQDEDHNPPLLALLQEHLVLPSLQTKQQQLLQQLADPKESVEQKAYDGQVVTDAALALQVPPDTKEPEPKLKAYVSGTNWPYKTERSMSEYRKTATSNIVTIDLGSNCSVAYCCKGESKVRMLKLEGINERVPTRILINEAGQVINFGRSALMEYLYQKPEMKKNLHYFNMTLHHDSYIQCDYTVKAMNGNEFFLVEVIAMILKHLKEKLLEFEGRGIAGMLKATNFEWVITVPAIWSSKGKQMMREAAYKAGLTSDVDIITTLTKVQRHCGRLISPPVQETYKLSLVMRPEAAAIHCKNVVKSRGMKCANSRSYMVVVIGRETIDITAHRVSSSGAIDIVLSLTESDSGDTQINAAFKTFLGKLVDDPEFHKFISFGDSKKIATNSVILDELVNVEFEDHKQKFVDRFMKVSDGCIVISLPHKFMNVYGDTLDNIEESKLQQLDCEIKGEELHIFYRRMEIFFKSAVTKIIKCINCCLTRLKSIQVKIDTVFLVGEFVGWKYLHQRITEELQRYHSFHTNNIIHTDDHEYAVVLGATAFQQGPSIIYSRLANATYGVECSHLFNPEHHDSRYRFSDDDGQDKCSHLFTPFVHRNDVINTDALMHTVFSPSTHDANKMHFNIYSSQMTDIPYVSQPDGSDLIGVHKIGTLTVKMPNKEGDKKRRVKLTMDFSQTEIRIQAYDITSGEKVTTVIDFFQGNASHEFHKLDDLIDL